MNKEEKYYARINPACFDMADLRLAILSTLAFLPAMRLAY